MPTMHTILETGAEADIDTRPAGLVAIVSAWIAKRAQLRRTRADLLDLSDHQLRDIGLTPQQAVREALLPWWR
ncbi:MAG: DUF1127 domain-containing protein [Rhizobiaceae bacterium]|nr:DUF1127 domain-containing protein [Rhizobiaceae bacterium]